jgi:hypothetical protein
VADNVSILDSLGATKVIATRDLSGVHHQLQIPYQQNRSDSYTSTTTGAEVDCSSIPVSQLGMQVKGTGAAPTSWTIVLEVSLDGTNYSVVATHTNITHADGSVLFVPLPAPVKKFRSRCTAISLGGASAIAVAIIGQAA